MDVSTDSADRKGLARNVEKGSADPTGRNGSAGVPLWVSLISKQKGEGWLEVGKGSADPEGRNRLYRVPLLGVSPDPAHCEFGPGQCQI